MNDPSPIDTLSIDCVIFGFRDDSLQLLIIKHADGIGKGRWGLPGGWINKDESLEPAAYRILEELTSIRNIYLKQLRAFGDVHRYPARRVITVAYFALVNPSGYDIIPGNIADEAKWQKFKTLPELLYDHREIVDHAFDHLQQKVRNEPIGFNLLPREFTLFQLQKLYEAVLQMQLDKSNFRRKIMKMNLLVKSEKKQTDVPHRAAQLYSFDEEVYNRLLKKGFNFEI